MFDLYPWRRACALALVGFLLAAAGCATPPLAVTHSPEITGLVLEDGGVMNGPVDRTWSWHVEPGFSKMAICVSFFAGNDQTPLVIGAHAQLSRAGANGFEVVGQKNAASTGLDRCWFAYDDGQEGAWKLQLRTDGGIGAWAIEVQVRY